MICLSLLFGLKIIQTVFLILHTISSLVQNNSSSLISAGIAGHDGLGRTISSASANKLTNKPPMLHPSLLCVIAAINGLTKRVNK